MENLRENDDDDEAKLLLVKIDDIQTGSNRLLID